MPNINRVSSVGGLVFAIFDVICAILAAFALQPFLAFWSYVAHIRLTGAGVESNITFGSFITGIIGAFAVGYILTWLFVWLHRKICCPPRS